MTSAPSFRLLPVEATEAMLDTAATEDWCDWDQQMRADHYAALYRAMVSAAPIMAEATGWQPISSAPKDGTCILAYKPDEPRTGDYTAVVYWGEWPHGDEGWIAVAGNKVRPPTHWMPLPAPPALNAALAIAAGQLGEKESRE